MISPPRIAASILAADFARLGEEVLRVEPYVDLLHIDVMDGHFVPNITFGVPVIKSIREVSELTFDCHLMMTNPDTYLEQLREAGADIVSVHIEVFPEPSRVAEQARAEGMGFGLALNPATPLEAVEPYLELCDLLVVMSVEPGFGGQEFIEATFDKVQRARKLVDSHGLPTDIEIDGGIGPGNVARARAAGVDVFVAGNAVFRAPDPVAAVLAMRAEIDR